MLPELLHVLRGADCQLMDCLLQVFAADAEPAKRSESVVFVCSACHSHLNDHSVDDGGPVLLADSISKRLACWSKAH